ncbi:LPS translocon maturation chaperone LptM [Balneatrix alpica]|uniref:Lipoprotein n=1 Tax=Balneatrix alpica TaxID=75684 RepID=A0ABV5ZFG0_9GAMM|nr:lipoprotein [Balneatrix alpica]
MRKLATLVLLSLTLLAGCGNKGPLYLPDSSASSATTTQ